MQVIMLPSGLLMVAEAWKVPLPRNPAMMSGISGMVKVRGSPPPYVPGLRGVAHS